MAGGKYSNKAVKKLMVNFALVYIGCLFIWDTLSGVLDCTLPGAEAKAARRRELHLGGIFPINGTGGWQGGQVSYKLLSCI